eukprot:scaffold1942_cov121-Skeletonema_menzelii.AAC.1
MSASYCNVDLSPKWGYDLEKAELICALSHNQTYWRCYRWYRYCSSCNRCSDESCIIQPMFGQFGSQDRDRDQLME